MNRTRFIVGLVALLLMAALPTIAHAGVMASDAMLLTDVLPEGVQANEVGGGMAATPVDAPRDSESPVEVTLSRLAAQPAQSGAGATGSATSVMGSFGPVAMLSPVIVPASAEPAGFCVDLENSQLPAPPTSDLLRPPRHAG
jgi:hypothetical protein